MLEHILLPFNFEFMQKAFIITMLVAIPMSILSCYLVLKGWSLMGDAISHAVLPGIVIAYIINIPLAIGAFTSGLFCALATGFLKENSRIKEDTVMGVVFSGMFAFGLVLYIKIESDVHLDHIIFGDMLGVSWRDIIEASFISILSLLFLVGKHKDLLLCAFDGQHAKAIGLPVTLLHYALLTVLSLSIVIALKAVGIILAVAMLVTPGAIAFLISKEFSTMILTSLLVSVVAVFIGIYASFHIDSAPAPTIVLTMSLMFVVVFIRSTRQQR